MTRNGGSVIHVPITIGREEYLKVYQGSARNVFAHDVSGRSVSFPAKILQPFVTHSGIQGLFAIRFSEAGKFLSIERIADGRR